MWIFFGVLVLALGVCVTIADIKHLLSEQHGPFDVPLILLDLVGIGVILGTVALTGKT